MSAGYVKILTNLFNNAILNVDISILHHVIIYHTAALKQQPILGTKSSLSFVLIPKFCFQPPGRADPLFILYTGHQQKQYH